MSCYADLLEGRQHTNVSYKPLKYGDFLNIKDPHTIS